jgi:hypothetical protein
VSDRPDFLAGIGGSERSTFFDSLRVMLDDLDIENRALSDTQLERAVALFDEVFASSSLAANDRHEVLYRFAKAGGLPWLSRLADIRDSVTAAPGDWTSR